MFKWCRVSIIVIIIIIIIRVYSRFECFVDVVVGHSSSGTIIGVTLLISSVTHSQRCTLSIRCLHVHDIIIIENTIVGERERVPW